MENRAYLAEITACETFDEFRLVQIVVDLAIDEIPELVRARQVVDRDDARLAALVERLDNVRADKTGCAGDDEVMIVLPEKCEPCVRRARRAIACAQ